MGFNLSRTQYFTLMRILRQRQLEDRRVQGAWVPSDVYERVNYP